MISEETIRQWWDLFRGDRLTEIRVLESNKKNWSGYFTDVETMLMSLRSMESFGIYSPINSIKEGCYGRTQKDKMVMNAKSTTSDSDIEGRDIVLIDLDPKRPSDTNSNEEEKTSALMKCREIFKFLRNQGFSDPVVADSANGYHLYYKVGLANTQDNTELVKRFLQALDMIFSDDKVDVDTSVFNASRIAKVIGTSSNKGTNTEDRPQRMSRFVSVPEEWRTNDKEYIEKVASLLPVPETPSKFNGYSTEKFDIEGFISKHGIKVARRQRFSAGEKLILEECPFDGNHKAPDSAIFVLNSGAIGFKCLHNSCSQYTWRDVRLLFEPDAYDKKTYGEFRQRQQYNDRTIKDAPVVVEKESNEKGKKWLQMTDIAWVDPNTLPSIPTGITELDRVTTGLILGDVTVISGLSGSGKTSIIDFIALNAIQRGYKVAVWSGELQDFRFQSWIDQIAAGKNYTRQRAGYSNLWYAPKMTCDKINNWLNGKLWLYNNNYGQKWSQIFSDIKECVRENGTQLLVVDNLMALQLDYYHGEKNDRQSGFINDLKNFAKQSKIHVILVCHPRKEQSFQLLRKESISGTADLTNLADNVFICHRVGNDFRKRATDFYGDTYVTEFLSHEWDEAVEICKNRSQGVQDKLIGLLYEVESRRYKNDRAEHILYGWQEETQTKIEYTAPVDDTPFKDVDFLGPNNEFNDFNDLEDLPV